MRTTLNIDDELIRRARLFAKRRGVTLTEVVEDSLRDHLADAVKPQPAYEPELPVIEGTAPPAVDIADRNALYEFMEERG